MFVFFSSVDLNRRRLECCHVRRSLISRLSRESLHFRLVFVFCVACSAWKLYPHNDNILMITYYKIIIIINSHNSRKKLHHCYRMLDVKEVNQLTNSFHLTLKMTSAWVVEMSFTIALVKRRMIVNDSLTHVTIINYHELSCATSLVSYVCLKTD